MRKCPNCRREMASRRENHKYDALGLDNVTLVGVEVWSCKACGERAVTIPRPLDLSAAIASYLAKKVERLTPKEIRFLRTYLGLSSSDFAKRMGVAKQTVSRWESIEEPLGMKTATERFLRLMALHERPVQAYSLADLDETATEAPKTKPLRMRTDNEGWAAEGT